MAAFLQKTLCWPSGSDRKSTARATIRSNAEECWGPPATEGDRLRADGGQESRRIPGSSRKGRSEFTDVTQVTCWPSSIPGHAA